MPQLIREYIAEMKLHLEYLTRQPELPLGEKLDFLRETRHCYGRTALVLSGGGALGVFHLVRVPGFRVHSEDWCHTLRIGVMAASLHPAYPLHAASMVPYDLAVSLFPHLLSTLASVHVQGVVKALFDNGLLPKVLSGSSVGSISASLPLPLSSLGVAAAVADDKLMCSEIVRIMHTSCLCSFRNHRDP